MEFRPILSPEQKSWLSSRGYTIDSFIAKGKSAGVWKVSKQGKLFAAKVEHEKSTRFRMLDKESRVLQMANEVKVGPRIMACDVDNGILIMDFIDGIPLANWLDKNTSKLKLKKMQTDLVAQAKRLDDAGIDHGQLGGKLHNILVDKKSKPWIIDFEKASYVRRVHNVSKVNAIFHERSMRD